MKDKRSNEAAVELFKLLDCLQSLRLNPQAIEKLNIDDKKLLEEALSDYSQNASFLASHILEPLREKDEQLASDGYNVVRRIARTSALIGATLIFSDSTKAFLNEPIIKDHQIEKAAKARQGRAEKAASANSGTSVREKIITKHIRGHEKDGPYTLAGKLKKTINKSLADAGFEELNAKQISFSIIKIRRLASTK